MGNKIEIRTMIQDVVCLRIGRIQEKEDAPDSGITTEKSETLQGVTAQGRATLAHQT